MPTETKLRNRETEPAANFGVRGLNPESIRRIEEARKSIGSRRDLAHRAGIALSTLNEALKGEREPRFSTMVAIARALGRPVDWVVTGDEAAGLATISVSAAEFVMVPVLPEAVSAGGGAMLDVNDLEAESQVAFRGEWMRRIGVNPKRAHVLRVKGDSMEPTLSEGDVVLVDTADVEPAGGGLYVLNWSGEAIVKRLDRDFDGALLVTSDAGQRYPPRRIDAAAADQVRIIGRVRWYARTLR